MRDIKRMAVSAALEALQSVTAVAVRGLSPTERLRLIQGVGLGYRRCGLQLLLAYLESSRHERVWAARVLLHGLRAGVREVNPDALPEPIEEDPDAWFRLSTQYKYIGEQVLGVCHLLAGAEGYGCVVGQ